MLTAIPAWLFYEVTVANMGAPSDDRSTRLRVWFLSALPALTVSTLLVDVGRAHRCGVGVRQRAALLWAFGCFGAFLFAGEPLGTVRARAQRTGGSKGASALRRSLGPGILSSRRRWLAAAHRC